MSLADLLLRLRAFFMRRHVEQELDDELRFHLDMEVEKNLARGLNAEEARHQALRAFGGVAQAAENCRDERRLSMIDTLTQDARYALRTLARSPYFTLTAVLTLAIGIGANTTIFTAINSALVRGLPYRNPEGLVQVFETKLNKAGSTGYVKPADFVDWRMRSRNMEGFATYTDSPVTWSAQGGQPERLSEGMVSPNFFRLLRVDPVLGRTFENQEETPGKDRVVMLSYAFWNTKLAANPDVTGSSLTLDGSRYAIVGVLPASFQFADIGAPDVWTPFAMHPGIRNDRYGNWFQVLARIRDGVTPAAAQDEMESIAAQLRKEYPDTNGDVGVKVAPLHQQMVAMVRPALLGLMAAVGLVLLIACANVANLLLARAVPRQREMAIRTALGARRGRLIRQLLVEALLLSIAGSTLGIVLAREGVRLILAAIPNDILAYYPYLKNASMDGTVLAFTLALSVATAVICGLVPALESSRQGPQEALRGGPRNATSTRSSQRLRNLFVAAEIALATVLLVTSGLAIRSLMRMLSVDPGFRLENLLTARVSMPANPYLDPARVVQAERASIARLRAVPGVRDVAILSSLPMSGADFTGFGVVGQAGSPLARPALHYSVISPNALNVLGIALARGREFTDLDKENTAKVVIVNEALARRFFPDKDPVGQRIILWRISREPREIVGVARNIRDFSLDLPTEPAAYLPFAQAPTAGRGAAGSLDFRLAVLTEHPMAVASTIRNAMADVERNAAVSELRTMEDLIAHSPLLVRRRVPSVFAATLALSALLLAAVGISGVVSSAVSQRVQEIGIRMALGADAVAIWRMVLGQTLALMLAGLAIGVIGAVAAARMISGWLFEVGPNDPFTYAAVALTLISVGLLSCYFPARRATRIDPTIALRYE